MKRFTPSVGLSDHTAPDDTGLAASKIALALGAECIERHYTVLERDETRDGRVSITPPQLKELREFANLAIEARMDEIRKTYPDWEKTLGCESRELSHQELLNRDYYAGRLANHVAGRVIYNWEDVDLNA